MNRIMITDMYWRDIYLNIVMEGTNLEQYEYFICNLKNEIYPLETRNGVCVINIVNIPGTKLLKNGKWFILAKKSGTYFCINISTACGYKLEQLDKIYRYGKEQYAYLVSFSVKDEGDVLNSAGFPQEISGEEYKNKQPGNLVCCIHTSYMMKNRRNDRRNIIVESTSLKEFCKKALFIILKRAINLGYNILCIFRKKDGKHILLMSETRVPISGNLLALDKRIRERKLDERYNISYSFSKTLQDSKWKILFVWIRLLWLLSKQDIVFVDDYVPIFKTVKLKKETRLIQLWHAGVGFKSVGYARFGHPGSPHPTDSCHRRYDRAVVGGKGLIEVYEEVFGIPKKHILPYGLPRLDGYLDTERIERYRKTFYMRFPELKVKKIILFAPTFRGTTQDEAFYPLSWIPQEDIVRLCGDQYVFAYKMHPFIKEKVEIREEFKEYIYDFSDENDINELFYVTDILITDFSSNIYEFSLHRKPIIFYAPDKDFYQLTRGVHRTLDQAPAPVCVRFEEVEDIIKNGRFESEKLDDYINESFAVNDKYASDLLIDNLILHYRED